MDSSYKFIDEGVHAIESGSYTVAQVYELLEMAIKEAGHEEIGIRRLMVQDEESGFFKKNTEREILLISVEARTYHVGAYHHKDNLILVWRLFEHTHSRKSYVNGDYLSKTSFYKRDCQTLMHAILHNVVTSTISSIVGNRNVLTQVQTVIEYQPTNQHA